MISADPAQLMNEIIDRIQQINLLTIRITQGDNFFSSLPSLRLPQFQHPELGMLKLVSWLYAFYQELGKPNIDFIKERFELYLGENNSRKNHVKTVLRLRTLFQHNLDPMSQSDNSTQEICELWFKDVCGSSYPEDDQQWSLCLVGLLRDTKNFLVDVHKCIQAIDADEARVEILRQWAFRRKQYHPQHEFDRVIQIVASDLGRDINPKKFSNRYL
ncbi:MAG: hypothetical protein H6673_06535 [Anaerolineales bacterium]|nr:hypothetical protein [Anaerolineales bacterium]